MWFSDLPRCFIVLNVFYILGFADAWDWESYKANSINNDLVTVIPLQVHALSNTPGDLESGRNLTGFDFNEEEIARLKLWPEGNIPFYIDQVSYDKVFRDNLRLVLENVNKATGVGLIEIPKPPFDEKTRWIFFVNRRGLLKTDDYTTKNFTNAGVQKVVLGYDCLRTGELFKVILAIVGVPPQHNAPNRDKHIKVIKENIIPEKIQLFDVISDKDWLFNDLEYDFQSAGHFDFHKHTKNGFATIEPKSVCKNALPNVGQPQELSQLDITKIRMLYHFIANNNPSKIQKKKCKKNVKKRSKTSSNKKTKKLKKNSAGLKKKSKLRKKTNKYLGNDTQSNDYNDKLKLTNAGDAKVKVSQEKTNEIIVKDNAIVFTATDSKKHRGTAENIKNDNKLDNTATSATKEESVTMTPYKLVKFTKKIMINPNQY